MLRLKFCPCNMYLSKVQIKDFKMQLHLQSNGQGADIHALGSMAHIVLHHSQNAWSEAEAFLDRHQGKFIAAAFSYDLKNDVESLQSENPSCLGFPSLILFVPQCVYSWEMGEIQLVRLEDKTLDTQGFASQISALHKLGDTPLQEVKVHRMSKENYLEKVHSLQAHIQRGDIYEVNLCQEFFIEDISLNPWQAFASLNAKTKAPYACHFRWKDLHLLCGSPELFLEKEGQKVVSRPIKGTSRRGKSSEEDIELRRALQNDLKERAENVMITDLVRNDLSRTALPNSVQVEELCEVYSYETVHQMISTIVSQVDSKCHPITLIKSCFPMGSMTGAPKVRAMELIESHEDFRRGIYSGAVGLFSPDGDFTLNVIIRSILYNAKSNRASVAAGGAITILSEPEKEYEESLLKAEAMLATLGIKA